MNESIEIAGRSIEIAGQVYRIYRKLNAFDQFHVARRIAPFLKAFQSAASVNEEEASSTLSIGLAEILSQMTDETCDYVINKCLATCQRKVSESNWAPLMQSNNMSMYKDLDMATLIRLTIDVISENNLFGFFGAVQDSTQLKTAAQNS